MDWLEIAGVVVGLAYIWLEYKASMWLWLTGIIMPAIYIFVYYNAGIYADMGINVYYLLAGIYGWLMWVGHRSRRTGEKKPLPITYMPASRWLPVAGVTLVCYGVIAYVLVNFTNSDVPYIDSFTTALSIAGMWMLAHKYVEQWIVWIIVDVVSCVLYFYKGLDPTALLYGLYSVIAVFGYFKWLKIMKQEQYDSVTLG